MMVAQFKACSVDGCNGNAVYKTLVLCNIHYNRQKRHGDPTAGGKMQAKRIARGGACRIAGCKDTGEQKGYCQKHYSRLKRHGDPLAGRPLRHGQFGTRLHRIWKGMRNRCGHTSGCDAGTAKYYRDKGVRVCAEWQDFAVFAEWANANGYADNLTIDRINSDGSYEASNCRWVTILANIRTRASNKLDAESVKEIRRLRAEGVDGATLAKRYGVCRDRIYKVCNGQSWA